MRHLREPAGFLSRHPTGHADGAADAAFAGKARTMAAEMAAEMAARSGRRLGPAPPYRGMHGDDAGHFNGMPPAL